MRKTICGESPRAPPPQIGAFRFVFRNNIRQKKNLNDCLHFLFVFIS